MEAQSLKSERIDIRVSPEEKEMFVKAQKISGARTFSGYVTQVIKSKSSEIIEENERILRSDKDREVFFDALYSSIEPNESLKAAARKYKSTKD